MWPPSNPSSPVFPNLEPVIVDGDMDNPYGDSDMNCFDPAVLDSSATDGTQNFEDLLLRPSTATQASQSASCLSPARLMKAGHQPSAANFTTTHSPLSDTRSDSPEDSSHSSSADSPPGHLRNGSVNSNTSAVFSQNSRAGERFSTPGWPSLDEFTVGDSPLFGQSNGTPSLNGDYNFDTDLETSNKAMNSAFDFDSAASSPSPLKMEAVPEPSTNTQQPKKVFRGPSNTIQQVMESNSPSSNFPPSTNPFYFHGSLDMSKPPVFQAKGRSGSSQWEHHSPASELEETFGSINMNGANSPLSSTLSPSLNFGVHKLNFDPMAHPSVPQFHTNGAAAPAFPPNIGLENYRQPRLVVHPTSLKSRVETQIPIKLTLCPLPPGVKKLRLPSHAISKPKFLAKPDTRRSSEILELRTNVVCTSAMQDKKKLERAFARARGEEPQPTPVEPDSKNEGQPKEETPLDGADVKICSGCIQRERKRASRKKQRKPEEDELFQKDEEKRVIVFNTTELKDWVEPTRTVAGSAESPANAAAPPGSMQVELPMRIACYCRHQNEKLGFQVIFTVKDHLDNTVAQSITNSIMITDDHKTHAPANSNAQTTTLPLGHQLPGAGVFPANMASSSLAQQPPFRLSHSATDLQALRNNQFSVPQEQPSKPQNTQSNSPAAAPPRSLSRQASPNDLQGPSSKRRKQSGSGKLPAGLTMTKVESPRNAAPVANSTANKQNPRPSRMPPFNGQAERPFVIPSSMTPRFGTGPPTPNNNDMPFFSPLDRPQSSENPPQQQLISAPSSTQTSRPGSPGPGNQFQTATNAAPGPVLSSQAWGIPPPNPPNRLPTMIHKLVPSEGSTTGGSEVTLLGSGFYPGMEVVFGDTLATTTTFWGDKCLNCLTPPALQPGTVQVVFKHEHPTFGQVQPSSQPIIPKQPVFFRYVDDRELQMYRVALGILGQKLRNPADAFQTAQQIMGGASGNMWNLQGSFQGNGQGHGNSNSQANMTDLDAKMLVYLEFMDLDDSPRSPRFNRRSPSGQTLLHYATSLGLTRFAAGLLARGANPDVQDNNGNSPLHLAALSGHTHIVHRLRLSGANMNATNLRDFTPADLASSLEAHRAVLVPAQHRRSRSVGSTPSLRRRPSSASLDLSWESSSGDSEGPMADSSDNLESESNESESAGETSDPAFYYPQSRRASTNHDNNSSFYFPRPHESNAQPSGVLPQAEGETEGGDENNTSPARLMAWRDQLAAQIHQFQQSVNWTFPNLPALPPMPTLPDYQTHPMMRRITSLVPQRPTTSWSTTVVKDSWDRLTGNTSPPAYEDLYPIEETEEDYDVKKSSLAQAAAEAAVDQHFEAVSEGESSASSVSIQRDIGDVRIGRKNIPREQQEKLRQAHARKMKRIRSDRNLFFIWIPLLIVIAIAMLQNLVPDIWHRVAQGYQFVKARYRPQVAEKATTFT